MRRKVIAGNWKMNMLPDETIKFIEEFAPFVKDGSKEILILILDLYLMTVKIIWKRLKELETERTKKC